MNDREDARLLAERYLDFQPRTSAEVRRRLRRAGFTEDTALAVVADLERAGLLNDARFSQEWVESRSRAKGLGSRRLASELRNKGVAADAADPALQALSPEIEMESALAQVRRRLGMSASDSTAPPLDAIERRRLTQFLQRRGFGWGIIEQVFRQLSLNDD